MLSTDHASRVSADVNVAENHANVKNSEIVVIIANVVKVVALRKPAANVFKFAAHHALVVQITTAALDANAISANQSNFNFSSFCVVDRLSTKSKIITSAR